MTNEMTLVEKVAASSIKACQDHYNNPANAGKDWQECHIAIARAAIGVVLREMMKPNNAVKYAGTEMMPVIVDYTLKNGTLKADVVTERSPRFVPCTDPFQAMLKAFAAEHGIDLGEPT